MVIFLVDRGADLLSNNEAQYRRATEFAQDNSQYTAKKLTGDLYGQVLVKQATSFIDMGGDAWAGAYMGNFGDSLS
jgi:hypothetical protein